MMLFSNWHFMRLFRAAIAIWAGFEFSKNHEWMFLAFGGLFALQAIFDIGCCGPAGCGAPPMRHNQSAAPREVEYEEVK